MPVSLGLSLRPQGLIVSGGGAVPSFAPSDIPGLLAWYRADLGYTAGSPSTWANQGSMTGATLSSATPPVNSALAGYNNQNVCTFDTTDVGFVSSGLSGPHACTGLTVFVVGEPGSGAVYKYAWSADEGGNEISLYQTPTGEVAFYNTTGAGELVGPAWSGKQAVCGIWNGASSRLYLSQKSSPTTGTVTAPSSIADNAFSIGDVYLTGSPIQGGGTGRIAEICVYVSALSEANVGLLMDYAEARYTVTVTP